MEVLRLLMLENPWVGPNLPPAGLNYHRYHHHLFPLQLGTARPRYSGCTGITGLQTHANLGMLAALVRHGFGEQAVLPTTCFSIYESWSNSKTCPSLTVSLLSGIGAKSETATVVHFKTCKPVWEDFLHSVPLLFHRFSLQSLPPEFKFN